MEDRQECNQEVDRDRWRANSYGRRTSSKLPHRAAHRPRAVAAVVQVALADEERYRHCVSVAGRSGAREKSANAPKHVGATPRTQAAVGAAGGKEKKEEDRHARPLSRKEATEAQSGGS